MKKILVVGLLSITTLCAAVWQPHDSLPILPSLGKDGVAFILPELKFDMAYGCWDANQDKKDLQTLVFGKENLTISDVYLPAKLAEDGKTQVTAGEWETVLGKNNINFDARQKRFALMLQSFWGLHSVTQELDGFLGIQFPIEYYQHDVNVSVIGSSSTALAAGLGSNPEEFFPNYTSVEAFFEKEILGAKGLNANNTKRSFHIGSIRLIAGLDLAPRFAKTDTLQMSAFMGLPAGKVKAGTEYWPVEHGTGGALNFGGSFVFGWNINKVWNPIISAQAMAQLPDKLNMRVPKQLTLTAGQSLAPSNYTNMSVAGGGYSSVSMKTEANLGASSITYYDATVPYFSNEAIRTKRRRGEIAEVGILNRFHHKAWNGQFGYMFFHKSKDHASTEVAGTYNFDTVTAGTNETRHQLLWDVDYEINEYTSISFGSKHTFKGKNTPQYHSFLLGFNSQF